MILALPFPAPQTPGGTYPHIPLLASLGARSVLQCFFIFLFSPYFLIAGDILVSLLLLPLLLIGCTVPGELGREVGWWGGAEEDVCRVSLWSAWHTAKRARHSLSHAWLEQLSPALSTSRFLKSRPILWEHIPWEHIPLIEPRVQTLIWAREERNRGHIYAGNR